MRLFASWVKDLLSRIDVLKTISVQTSVLSLKALVSNINGLIGIFRWVVFPVRYSIAHMDYASRVNAPFGHRWIFAPDGRKICSGCATGRPMDFLEFAIEHTRWDPAAAHMEAMELIERGEMENTPANHNRWANIPDGAMILWTSGTPTPEDALPMLVVFNFEGDYYSTCLSHLADLRQWEFDLFAGWLAEVVPEWQIERDGPSLQVAYDSRKDPMAGVNPYAFMNPANQPEGMESSGILSVLSVHEEDYDDE